MAKLFVKCMLCCIWQHEWEAELSDQGWTSHLTSNMKGKIGHYRGCIQTAKHKSKFAYSLHKWIVNNDLQCLLKYFHTGFHWEIEISKCSNTISFPCPKVSWIYNRALCIGPYIELYSNICMLLFYNIGAALYPAHTHHIDTSGQFLWSVSRTLWHGWPALSPNH